MQHVVTLLLVLALGVPAQQLPVLLEPLARRALGGEAQALWLTGGLVAGIVSCLGAKRSPRVRFLTVLLHEHAHLMMALLVGTSPRSLSAGEAAGLFRYDLRGPLPRVRAFFITVAPYWISPLWVAPIALALAAGPTAGLGRGALAWLLGVCLVLPLAEIHHRQPDLRRYGVVPPILASLWLWAGLAAVSLAVVSSGSLREAGRIVQGSWRVVVGLV